MNQPIRAVSVAVMVMFLALMANASASSVLRQTELNENPQNRRVSDARFAQNRGAILVGKTAIASSTPVKDRFKYQREYSNGKLYAPITGYYSYFYGTAALENTQSRYLSGSTDLQVLDDLIKSAAGQVPKGAEVHTTISAKAQKAAWDALDGRKGAIVALDFKTGAVKALVSYPSYDPAQLATHDLDASKAAWEKLNADTDRPMANRATREIYSPGSTFKLVTAAAVMEELDLTPDSTVDASAFKLPGSTKTYKNNCGGDEITLRQALMKSCNPAFARLGVEVGAEKLQAQAEKFGFGQRFLDDIGSAASKFPTDIDGAQTGMSAIGEYEVQASPLQMALVVAAIANDGIMMQPYVVESVVSENLATIYQREPQQALVPISVTTARGLQSMMETVVESGTGYRAAIPGETVGGKTGTAVTDRVRSPYAWFVAFAKERHIAVAVFIEDAGLKDDDEVAGGKLASPVAKAVLEALK
ncbi:MAG: penicillin-binding protein 2 [Propionibacteriaceae bacterium]|jgi:peptidoglycan glycosyltransferase|nr:penicillin-binding protein 2 [Propionibacteriaceae bacterium]